MVAGRAAGLFRRISFLAAGLWPLPLRQFTLLSGRGRHYDGPGLLTGRADFEEPGGPPAPGPPATDC